MSPGGTFPIDKTKFKGTARSAVGIDGFVGIVGLIGFLYFQRWLKEDYENSNSWGFSDH